MNKSMLKKIMFIDWRLGIRKRWLYYAITLVIFIIEIGYFGSQYEAFYRGRTITSHPGIMDCLLFIFNGTEEFTIGSGTAFNIPSLWLLVNLFLMYMIGYYPIESIKKQSIQVLIRCKNRAEYWLSKIIWCIITTILFFFLLCITSIVLVAFLGGFSASFHNDICQNIMGFSIRSENLLMFLAPFLITLMMTIVQVNISVLVSPIIANFIMVMYMVCSIYYSNSFLVYNYCMYNRIFSGNMNNEFGLATALIFSLLLMIISSILALRKVTKIDVI